MNVEESKILDEKFVSNLAEQALKVAGVSNELAVADQKATIARTEANQKAESDSISAKSKNALKVGEAQAELDAATLKARAKGVEAKAITDAAELQGKLYKQFPELLELELAKIKYAALSRVNFSITSAEFSSMFASPGMTLFGPTNNVLNQQPVLTAASSTSSVDQKAVTKPYSAT